MREKAVLVDHIKVAHNVLYQYYYELDGFHHIEFPSIEEFTYSFREQWRETNLFNDLQCSISARDLFNYVTKAGAGELKKYILFHNTECEKLCQSMVQQSLK